MSFSRVQLFKKYAPYMSEEDQATYTNHVIEELRMHLSYAKSKSKSPLARMAVPI